MGTSPSTVTFLLDQLRSIPGVRARKMFGEYALYCGEKVVALVCDDQLFVKMTEAGKALVEKYGVHFDPAVRDDIVARYKKLDLPIYNSGVYADLTPVKDKAGKITDVKVTYPRDFLAQQLEWARLNGTRGF